MAKGAGLGAWVDSDFAHAHQIVYVPASGGFDAIENPFKTGSSDIPDHGIELAEFILSKYPDTKAVIAGSFSPETKEYFESHHVVAVTEHSGSVLMLVEKLRETLSV